jgi:site-specific recombinase XerD
MKTSLEYFLTSPETISRRRQGPLACYLEQYAQRLYEQGYARQTGRYTLAVLGQFNDWLDKRNISALEVSTATADRYLRWRWRRCRPHNGDTAIVGRLLEMIHPEKTNGQSHGAWSEAEQAVAKYQRWLEQERGLTQATVVNYLPFVRKFVGQQFPSDEVDFARLSPNDITDFIQTQATLMGSSKRIQLLVTALRSFLRHLLQGGVIKTNLAACVPAVAKWSLSGVPKFLTPEQVQRILDSCDRSSACGKRDYAILLLLARLGLRASEVVALTLDDIDWAEGLITMHGKGKRVDQLPLPAEVGEAMTDYLRLARPACGTCRRVFIRDRAPLVGFANSIAICSLVDTALRRAGVESVRRGSHLFRHSLATRMINNGSSMSEIGELLRHRRPDTTSIYAKVDLTSLRTIALPWPGESQ